MSEKTIIKCVIWDLDETLWDGTLRSNDAIVLPEKTKALLQSINELGILQSIASKNDYEAAAAKLRDFGIDGYFVHPQVNYLSKVANIQKIIRFLNITPDTVLFIDDNSFETSQVNHYLPQITTLNTVAKLGDIIAGLESKHAIQTYENKNRSKLIRQKEQRDEQKASFKGTDKEFLKSCEMVLTVRKATEADSDRIWELSQRSNQLNSFKQARDFEELDHYYGAADKAIFVCELTDIFGYHGVVGICFLDYIGNCGVIKQFCISCRIEGRGIGQAFLAAVIEKVQEKEVAAINRVECWFHTTAKNKMVLFLLKGLGFKFLTRTDCFHIYGMDLPHSFKPVSWIEIRKENILQENKDGKRTDMQ